MERLTKRDKTTGAAYFPRCFDTCGGIGCVNAKCNEKFMAEVCQRLADYEDAEEQGRMMVLPCKAGDTVYIARESHALACVVQYFTIGDGPSSACVSFECDWECKGCPFWAPYTSHEAGDGGCGGEYGEGLLMFYDYGETVFLTREEAEAAMEAKEGNG